MDNAPDRPREYSESFENRVMNADLTTREGTDFIMRTAVEAISIPFQHTNTLRGKKDRSESDNEEIKKWSSIAMEHTFGRLKELTAMLENREEDITEAISTLQAEVDALLQELWPDKVESKRKFYFDEIYADVMEQYKIPSEVQEIHFESHSDSPYEHIMQLRILVDMRERLEEIAVERRGGEVEAAVQSDEEIEERGGKADEWIEGELQ